jgi:UDP-N-acetylglucosamine:LPS N-acetylglucosamine transferase
MTGLSAHLWRPSCGNLSWRLAKTEDVSVSSKRVIILYSSIGNGHISAAQAIQREIARRSPTADILLQDIRAFMDPIWSKLDERLFWFVVRYLPETYEALFLSMQQQGSAVSSLSVLPGDYPEWKVLRFVEEHKPDAILATHYGSAQVLGTLRESGFLADVRIGWLHTDFFEGYFPRISRRIDCTFLAHDQLGIRWQKAGVPAAKIAVTGMPVALQSLDPGAHHTLLEQLGFSPASPVVLITGGKEGLVDFEVVLKSLLRHMPTSLQVIVVCGKNRKQRSIVSQLCTHLPDTTKVRIYGVVPHEQMMKLMHIVDVVITKAGGMTPSEAFALGKLTILLDVVTGHEHQNAVMMEELGLAKVVSRMEDTGNAIAQLLSDPPIAARMRDAQAAFRDTISIRKIAEFALEEALPSDALPYNFGTENGAPVLNVEEVLSHASASQGSEVEVLLSYAASKTRQRIVTENPFGHIAVRIGSTVLSANHLAESDTDPNLLQHLSLADYLYGVDKPSSSQEHSSTYGVAYGRDTIGLRTLVNKPNRIHQMFSEAERIENEFQRGSLRWDRARFNCADVVAQILRAGGYDVITTLERLGLPTMPLDVFEQARMAFEQAGEEIELIAYRQIPGAQSAYHFSRFPLSLGKPLRSAVHVLSDQRMDPIEAAVKKQIIAYLGERSLWLEDLQRRERAFGLDGIEDPNRRRRLGLTLIADLRTLLRLELSIPWSDLQRLNTIPREAGKEIRQLMKHSVEVVRMTSEVVGSQRLRELWLRLSNEYRQLTRSDLQASTVLAYFTRVRQFKSAAFHDLMHLRRMKARVRLLKRHSPWLPRW